MECVPATMCCMAEKEKGTKKDRDPLHTVINVLRDTIIVIEESQKPNTTQSRATQLTAFARIFRTITESDDKTEEKKK